MSQELHSYGQYLTNRQKESGSPITLKSCYNRKGYEDDDLYQNTILKKKKKRIQQVHKPQHSSEYLAYKYAMHLFFSDTFLGVAKRIF
jgi:hypothetical protein